MPRDYWKWWWSGFAIVLAVSILNNQVLNILDTPARIIDMIAVIAWTGIAVVAWRRNQHAPKTLSFWWSIAAIAVYVVFAFALAYLPEAAQFVIAAIWGIVWIVGGIAVIIVWLIGKSKPPTPKAPTTRLCPYCAEAVQFAAIKCKHCGEALEPVIANETA